MRSEFDGPDNTWHRVLGKIRPRVSSRSFGTWFRPTGLLSEDGATLRVGVPNGWYAEWLTTNYMGLIREALSDLGRESARVSFVPKEDGTNGLDPAAEIPARRPAATGRSNGAGLEPGPWLNPRYRFDSFVVSSCNQFANAAARAVAEQPTRSYNPLFIYGGVGLGKTHLMQAIGNHLRRQPWTMRYVSSEHFMNELINAIRFEKTLEFKNRFRNVDLLLIDDIQFLEGKERTQEEFFHTFNVLYDSQKQIVITSDRPPRSMSTLEDRLRSRFEWGLIADIQPPDLETKVAILRKKAEVEGVVLPDDVALFIASNSKSNIRELEGALIRVVAYASVQRRVLDLDLAKETLKGLLEPDSPVITVDSIQKLVANYYNLKISELRSRNNSRRISFPRQIAMYLSKQLTDASLPEIGKRFGDKHHSTVIYAVQKIERKRSKEPDFNRIVEEFVQQLA